MANGANDPSCFRRCRFGSLPASINCAARLGIEPVEADDDHALDPRIPGAARPAAHHHLDKKSDWPEEQVDPCEKEGEEQCKERRDKNKPSARANVGLEGGRPNQEESGQTDCATQKPHAVPHGTFAVKGSPSNCR